MSDEKDFCYEVGSYYSEAGVAYPHQFKVTKTRITIRGPVAYVHGQHRDEIVLERSLCRTPEDAIALKRAQLEAAVADAERILTERKADLARFEKRAVAMPIQEEKVWTKRVAVPEPERE